MDDDSGTGGSRSIRDISENESEPQIEVSAASDSPMVPSFQNTSVAISFSPPTESDCN